MNYRPEIDGLRAISVLAVVFFHAGFNFCRGGFVGVDVFFVISGYLISTNIITKKEQNKFSLVDFYEKRARRILPALFLVTFLCLPFAWILFVPTDFKNFSKSLIAVATFSSNVLFWKESGYFNEGTDLKPLLHTWSLAVEEQYYILFPILFLSLWNFFGKKNLVHVITIIFLSSLFFSHTETYNHPKASFYLIHTRAWEILIGTLVAFIDFKKQSLKNSRWTNQCLALLGLLLIIIAVHTFDETTPFPGLYALAPTCGAALILLYGRKGTFIQQFLQRQSLVNVGLISYSIYLWHHPLLAFTRYYYEKDLPFWVTGILIILTIPLSYLSWKYVETPFRSKIKISKRWVLTLSLLGGLFFLSLGLIGSTNNGFEDFYVKHRLTNEQKNNYLVVKNHTNYSLEDKMIDNHECIFWNKEVNKVVSERFNNCVQKFQSAIVVLGDSHAMNLFNVIAKSSFAPFIVGISQGGCRPQNNKSNCHYDRFESFANENKNSIKYVLFHQSGSYFIEDEYGRVDSSRTFEKGTTFQINQEHILTAANYVAQLNALVPSYWIGPFTEARARLSTKSVMLQGHFTLNAKSLKVFKELEIEIRETLKNNKIFPMNRYISFDDFYPINEGFLWINQCLTFKDEDHLSQCGEDFLSKHVEKVLSKL